MNKLLKKIYENVINYEEDTIQMNKSIDIEIHTITDKYKDRLTADEMEELAGFLYHIALISQQEGFQLGMRYLLKLIAAIWYDL